MIGWGIGSGAGGAAWIGSVGTAVGRRGNGTTPSRTTSDVGASEATELILLVSSVQFVFGRHPLNPEFDRLQPFAKVDYARRRFPIRVREATILRPYTWVHLFKQCGNGAVYQIDNAVI